MTSFLEQPILIITLTLLVVAWMALNRLASTPGYRPWDPPRFPWLSGFASVASLYLVVVILTTQRRDNLLARHREPLNLGLARLSEQKSAKAIELLEELRRDSPRIRDRIDTQADEMARPADPHGVIDAIQEARVGVAQISNDWPGPKPVAGL